jgi:hypothetical protein
MICGICDPSPQTQNGTDGIWPLAQLGTKTRTKKHCAVNVDFDWF